MLGTPNYMSPEQVKCSDVTARSDLFSVGVVMYELLTGVKPFSAPDVSGILRNVVEKEPQLASEVNPEVPENVARFVEKLLPKSPDARFANALAALREVQALRGTTPTPTPPPEAIALTSAVPSEPEKGNETTDTNFNADKTPAIQKPSANTLPPKISYSIIGILGAGLISAIAIIHSQTDAGPIGVITPQQQAQAAAKKKALVYAQGLLSDGRYDESLQAYNDYLKIYPASVAGQQGRDQAARQVEAHRSKATVTAASTKPTIEEKKTEQKPGFWQRVFHRGKPQTPPQPQPK